MSPNYTPVMADGLKLPETRLPGLAAARDDLEQAFAVQRSCPG
jgi:hypothetical protein